MLKAYSTIINHEVRRHHLYTQCEKKFSTEAILTKYRGLNIDHLNENNSLNDEKQFICSLFRLVIPQDDIKRIILAKQDRLSQWNDNEMCIYYTRPIHLLWIKQKWLERYPLNTNNESQKWSQCIDWAIDSFLEPTTTTKVCLQMKIISEMFFSLQRFDHRNAKQWIYQQIINEQQQELH
jgi:hypothetical protein